MRKITCEICGVKTCRVGGEKRIFMAKFPLDEDRCKQWVKATGKEDLVYVPIEKLHQLKYICERHFRSKDFKKKKTQLKKNAIPCIKIPSTPLPDEILVGFPLHVAKSQILAGKATDNQRSLNVVLSIIHEEHNYSYPFISEPQPSTSSTDTSQANLKRRSVSPVPSTSTSDPNLPSTKKRRLSSPTPSTSSRKYQDTLPALTITPRKRKLLKKLERSRIKLKTLQHKVDQIEKISSPVLKSFIQSSIANQSRKPKGKRWTKLNKTVALAIYKKSPKAYRYLSELLPMPSIRTLQIVLENMKMDTGIDPTSINHLKKISETASDRNKICVILFDEIALKKRLIYNVTTDKIDGYVDLGNEERSEKIADHALVFMFQGVHEKKKQPIAHYFVKGTISTERLAVIIKDVIRAVSVAGYKVIATVCDQGPTNMGALNLLKTWSHSAEPHYFFLDEKKVFIIYDVPHLFKSIRNNFLQGGELLMDNKKAKWAHLINVELKNSTTLHFKKITKLHVNPKFRSKMRVKLAAEILSNTVAAILKLQSESVENQTESKEILETAEIIEDLDLLFDCTNGPASKHDIKKKIRQNVTKNSFHHRRWIEFKRKLQTLHFRKSDSQLRLRNVRCVNGYIITLSSFQDIWSYLNSMKFKYMNLRQFNQDALENLFGLIRQHCPTNRNPTCHHFTSALKSAILIRLSAPLSRGGNCEKDSNEILLDFQEIVFPKKEEQSESAACSDLINANYDTNNAQEDFPILHIPESIDEQQNDLADIEKFFKRFDKQPTVYVSGYLACALLKGVDCIHCINCLKVFNPEPNTIYNYIALREWWTDKTSLTYPSIQLCQAIDKSTNIFDEKVKPKIFSKNICNYSKTEILTNVDFSWMCEEHKNVMADKLLRRLSLLLIRSHCQVTNRSFALNEEASADVTKKAQQQSIAK